MSLGIVLFHTTSSCLRAEKVAVAAGLNVKLVPVPRHLSSDCGMAVRFDWNCKDVLELLLHEKRVETAGIHELTQ
jgi:hypothetical protein